MSGSSTDSESDRDPGVTKIAVVVVVFGLAVLGALAYADATGGATRAEYEQFTQTCDELANQSRVVDGGLGVDRVALNRTHVEQCETTTYAEYRRGRYRSMGTTPLNPAQWLWFGGPGLACVLLGGALLRRQGFVP